MMDAQMSESVVDEVNYDDPLIPAVSTTARARGCQEHCCVVHDGIESH